MRHQNLLPSNYWFILGLTLLLSGCQLLGGSGSNTAVGPVIGPVSGPGLALGEKKQDYSYHSDIYLDVAIPVFDPGIPEDYDELEDKSIWPQLRRAEANRFALKTKQALANTRAFGSINVVPTPQATAELYILGKTIESNSEDIEINIKVVDISGRTWGEENFEHRVSLGFFRDKKNNEKDPYEPIFTEIADYVFNLLIEKNEARKTELQQIANLRFAQSFSEESFSRYLKTNKNGTIDLISLPSSNDPMLRRIDPLRTQDQLFFDGMQNQYDAFFARTDESYLLWQQETLPEAVKAREAQRNQYIQAGLGVLLAAAIISQGDRIDSNTDKVLAGAVGVGSVLLIGNSFLEGKEAELHRGTIDELGESLDIEMDSQVIKLENKTVELSGTALEQHNQWREHLQRLYELEETPNEAL